VKEQELSREMYTLERKAREAGCHLISNLTLINLPPGCICTSQNINNGVLVDSFEVKTKSSPR